MSTLTRTLRFRLSDEPLDASLSWWGCSVGGLGICALAILGLRRYATTQLEFLLGVMASLVACLLLLLLGALARQIHLAVWQGKAPWRSRRGELVAHGVGLAVLGIGGWASMDTSPGMAGALTAGQLVLGVYVAVLCLGCWSTLAHAPRGSRWAELGPAPNGGPAALLGNSGVMDGPPSVR
jgi:hypothetical protein